MRVSWFPVHSGLLWVVLWACCLLWVVLPVVLVATPLCCGAYRLFAVWFFVDLVGQPVELFASVRRH